MFEKEAYNYSIDTYETCLYDNLPYVNDSRAREEAFREGAEFGYNKANEQLLKAKEFLAKWVELFKPKGGNIPPTPIQIETEQFIREVKENENRIKTEDF